MKVRVGKDAERPKKWLVCGGDGCSKGNRAAQWEPTVRRVVRGTVQNVATSPPFKWRKWVSGRGKGRVRYPNLRSLGTAR